MKVPYLVLDPPDVVGWPRVGVSLAEFTSKSGFLLTCDSWDCETLHSNCP